MPHYFDFPQIDPVIFSLGFISLRWYGLMYLLGFAFAYYMAMKRAKQPNSGWTSEQVDQLLFNGFFGVILGGRIGDTLFYQFDRFLADPLYVFRIWEGGMSFHGGLIGVILSLIYTSYRQKRAFWQSADFLAPLIPFGLGLGRIGNFINDELWGRVTDVPWAVKFPNGGYLPRHPSQLYEAFLEGVVLLAILMIFSRKPRPAGAVSGLFLIGYGLFRTLIEPFRQPESFDTIVLGLTRGQWLSVPMIVLGAGFMLWAYKKAPRN